MAKETMNLEEGLKASIISGGAVKTKPRHAVMGWGLIAAVLGALGYWFMGGPAPKMPAFNERPGLHESLGQKISGILSIDIVRASTGLTEHYGPFRNTVVNEGETALRDCFIASSCVDVQAFKYHGLGTSSAAIAETDGGCTTELTTQYNPDSTRATGTQTNNGANVYRTVGTNTVDGAATIEEFCLMATASGAGTMWTRILTGTIVLAGGDGLQTTYDLTIE
jgi:hypothetical protein